MNQLSRNRTTTTGDVDALGTWAASIDSAQAASLGALRLVSGIDICSADGHLWLRGSKCDKALQRRLRALPGARHFGVLPDRQLMPIESHVPLGWLPQGPWVSLARWLGVEGPRSCLPAQIRPTVGLKLCRSDDYCEPSALLTSLESWTTCATNAAQVRLDRWRFAVADDRRVLVRGQPLPSLPGQHYVDRHGIFVAAGWHWHPAIDAEVVRKVFALEKDDIALWQPDGTWERIAATDFVRATRAPPFVQAAKALNPRPKTEDPRPTAAMIDVPDYVAARRYLAPYPDSFWRWDVAATVVEWTDGTTIAFRQEIEGVLQRLSPHGLPPMNALMMLFAACRDSWPEMSAQLIAIHTAKQIDLPGLIDEVLAPLNSVRALPHDLRNDLTAKAVMAEMIFERERCAVGQKEAALVLSGLANLTDPGMVLTQQRQSRKATDFLGELYRLREGIKRVTSDALRLRLKTGLDALIKPAEVNLAAADCVRRLIAELRDDEALGGVSRMAGQLMAAMNLPRPINDREDLPVGGVSDITNRGQLDRLLISELAHDDLTLAVRVAVGEALYLRREAPPRNPPRHRAVLIDVGIRMWGVPRVFAAAVALAVAATADRKIEVDLFRAEGNVVVPVDLTDRDGLVDQMSAVAVDAHPGRALAPLLEAIEAKAEKGDAPGDIIVITSDDVLADDDFRRIVADLAIPSIFFATVNRDGRFRLLSRNARCESLVSQAQLNLDDLISGRPDQKKNSHRALIDERRSTNLPAILSVRPFPLLLSYQPIDPQRHWVAGKSIFGITRQRCLMQWELASNGARFLQTGLPDGIVHWDCCSDGHSLAIVGQLQQRRLSLVDFNLHDASCRISQLEPSQDTPLGVAGQGGVVFVVYSRHVDVIEISNGTKVQQINIPDRLYWKRDRFFCAGQDWYALSYNGSTACFEKIVAAEDVRGKLFKTNLTFVDVPGFDGPFGITVDGMLYSSADKQIIKVAHGLDGQVIVRGVARDGRTMVVSSTSDVRKMAVVDLPSGKSKAFSADPLKAVAPELQRLKTRSLRQRIRGVFVAESRRLTLQPHKGKCLHLDCSANNIIRWVSSPAKAYDVRNFRPLKSEFLIGFTLQVATWDDGSQAFFDSRGLLHLKSSDRAIPEFTLVVSEGPIAGWSSDGRLWGDAYFTGTAPEGQYYMNSSDRVYNDIILPFVERLR